ALVRAASSTASLRVTTAVPAVWLTWADCTWGRASRAFLTVASQWPHIIPSILMVFCMVVTSVLMGHAVCRGAGAGGSSTARMGLSFLALCRSNRFSRSALDTTQKL